ncbi:MAG: DUF1826 domain-containing protein [Cyclobacteriaceae bacterium]|jgi:hypothetical protein|nr:DUF1826 domain-containing protein [Cyclobacteriaceae bacterium]
MVSLVDFIPILHQRTHVLITQDLMGLLAVKNPHFNLGIGKRQVKASLENAVQELMHSSFQGIDKVLEQQESWSETMALLIGHNTTANWILLEPLINDISMCCALFVKITQARSIRLSLKVVNHDACQKFHIDGYAYRLLCSYCGPGTEWTYNDNVRRKLLGEGENEDIIKDWSRIERIATYDIAVLKGELPRQRTGKGIVHRSPPVSQTGEKRLVLRIDYSS